MGRLALSLTLIGSLLLAACSGNQEATASDVKAFEGAPPPAGAMDRAQQEAAKAREQAQETINRQRGQ